MNLSIEKVLKDKVLVTFENDDKNYILSKSQVLTKNTLFNTLLECCDKDKALIHNENTFTYDQFTVVYKILNNEKITVSEIKENEDILKYYLINDKEFLRSITDLETDKFFFCNKEKKYNEALEFIKDNKLPYLPFKVAFAKGSSGKWYNSTEKEIINVPIYISFGEYNNLFLLQYFGNIDENIDNEKLYGYTERVKKSYITCSHRNDYEDDPTIYKSLNRFIEKEKEKEGLEKASKTMSNLEIDIHRINESIDCDNYPRFHLIKSYEEMNNPKIDNKRYKLYHIDRENKLCIPPSYIQEILVYLKDKDFYKNLVKDFTENINIFQERIHIKNAFTDEVIFSYFISEVYGFLNCEDFINNTYNEEYGEEYDEEYKEPTKETIELYDAIREDNFDKVKTLISEGRVNVNVRYTNEDYYADTPLLYACCFESFEIAKLLIDNGAKVNVKEKYEKYTPLMLANNLEIAKLLIDSGAKVNAQRYGETALFETCRSENFEKAKLLIDSGVNIDIKNEEGSKALDHCSSNLRKRIDEYLKIKTEY